MVSLVVRVWMPDRPGALGQVASRIGAVRGDVLAIEILERGAGRAIDELTVRLPSDDLISLLTAEIDAVDGVSVEDVRPVDPSRVDANLAALALGAELVEGAPDDRLRILCEGTRRLVESDWAVLVREGRIEVSDGDAPDVGWLAAFIAGSEHLDELDEQSPSDLIWARLPRAGLTLAAGRADRPVHERERQRLSLLARLADGVVSGLDPVS